MPMAITHKKQVRKQTETKPAMCTILNNGNILQLQVNIYGANRHPKHVQEPEKFDPDRFDAKQENR